MFAAAAVPIIALSSGKSSDGEYRLPANTSVHHRMGIKGHDGVMESRTARNFIHLLVRNDFLTMRLQPYIVCVHKP